MSSSTPSSVHIVQVLPAPHPCTPRLPPPESYNPAICPLHLLTALTSQLIDENGMEVFTKYFTKLVHTSASQIFPGTSRSIGSATNTGSYSLLLEEMRKISHDVDQATKISESIETGTEDIFRDFDLSTFMEHFRLDALEKTILALAFKLGSRPDLKAKGMPRPPD